MPDEPYLVRDAHGVVFTVFHGRNDLWRVARGRWVAYAPIVPAAHKHGGWPIDAALCHFLVEGGVTVLCYGVGERPDVVHHLAYTNPANAIGISIPMTSSYTFTLAMAGVPVRGKRGCYYHLPDQFWQYDSPAPMGEATGDPVAVPSCIVPAGTVWSSVEELARFNQRAYASPAELAHATKCPTCGAALDVAVCPRCAPRDVVETLALFAA